MTFLEELDFRGLIYQVTDREGLDRRLQEGPITLYGGFDPTADSLTIGNLVPVLLLRRFQLAGHKAIALVGGGTGLIGDPGGKSQERTLNTRETVAAWVEKIRRQLEPFLDFTAATNPAKLVNNLDWLGNMGALDLLRDVGKHFPVPYMLAKDSVASRLETGISYTEFSYMILQSYDFLKLNELEDCELQVGGSDQWGNITAGSDLIRRTGGGKSAYGLTCPLLTTAQGEKFGKSEGNSIWLDAARTSPYQFYQFWINADDGDVVSWLKIFTFLSKDDIVALGEATERDPGKREAQRVLAREVTTLVHGDEATAKAERISAALFYGDFGELQIDEIEQGFDGVPTHTVGESGQNLVELLVEAGISSSKRQAREDVGNGAIYINGNRCTDLDRSMRTADGLHGKYIIIRRGKNKYFLIK
jgi:tyrosyl-tRNA synthetase